MANTIETLWLLLTSERKSKNCNLFSIKLGKKGTIYYPWRYRGTI